MSIVSNPASQANRRSTELPTTGNQANAAAADDHADGRSTAPRDGSESQARSPTGIRSPPNARDYIAGYDHLSKLGVGFYPIHPDKSPAVKGKLDREVTTDPFKLRYWAEHGHHRSFALRILRGSRLMVIDTESPFKHPDKPGPDGEMFLGSLLEDHYPPSMSHGADGVGRFPPVALYTCSASDQRPAISKVIAREPSTARS